MKLKIAFILLFCLISLSDVSSLRQRSQQKSQKPQLNQFSQIEGNQLEIITYIEGHGQGESGRLGYAVAGIGDINLDGFDDVIIGNLDKGPGEALILFGGTDMDSIPDIVLRGENERDLFGSNVAAGGDINGDGDPDFIVTASKFEHGKGRVYVYYGGSIMDTIPDIVLTGERWYDGFGFRIATGDVNSDNCDDILISTVNHNGSDANNMVRGKAYLYFGGALLDTLPDWTNIGDSIRTYLGSGLAIGDVNGDSKQDILMLSSPGGYNPAMTVTEIFLNSTGFDTVADYCLIYPLYGDAGERMLFCADFNQDGIIDFHTKYYGYKIFYGSQQFDIEPDAYLEPWPYTYISRFANAGDVNGDGYPDIIGGAPKPRFYTGSVQLFLGSEHINPTVDWTAGGQGILGWSVDGAGDVNGDGYDDIIVSDLILPFTNRSRGVVYILAGNPDLEDSGSTQVANNQKLTIPEQFKLFQNHPNPFNNQTTIHYELYNRKKQAVALTIYNIEGKEVIKLIDQFQSAGAYRYSWDGKDMTGQEVNSGIYFALLKVNGFHQVIKLLLVK